MSREQIAATVDAARQCKLMTQMMSDAIEKQRVDQEKYANLYGEYQRRMGTYLASKAEYQSKCPSTCANGASPDCHPMCYNWMRLNPAWQEPQPYIPPDLGTFVCSICSQVVDISGTAGRDINFAENAIQQQQTCITEIEKKAAADADALAAAEDAAAAAAARRDDSEEADEAAATTAAAVKVAREKADTSASSSAASVSPSTILTKRNIIIAVIFLTLIIIAITIAIIYGTSGEEDVQGLAPQT